MSTRRRTTKTPLGKLGRGPGGRRRCRWCCKEVKPPKITFCGPDCVHEHRIRSDPQYVRGLLFERDNGICALCGLDCIAEWHRLKLLERTDPAAYHRECQARKIPKNRKSLWDGDHILAVKDGGGECGLDNYRTLCLWCHRGRHRPQERKRKRA